MARVKCNSLPGGGVASAPNC